MTTLKPFDASMLFNPEQRLPCMILADISRSMDGEPLRQLNAGLDVLHRDILGDAMARKRVEIGLITFGGTPVLKQNFATADHISSLSGLTANGGTPMGAAITMALECIERRKVEYRTNGITYLRPWLWIITDGAPTDDMAGATAALRDAENADKVVVFTLGVDGADFATLQSLAQRPPLKLRGLDFPGHFEWLGPSLRHMSTSRPGNKIRLTQPTAAYPETVRT